MNTTAAVATPFGASSDMNISSPSLYSFLRLIQQAKNLIAVYVPKSIPDAMKNSFVNGILIIIPVSMKTSMYNAFAITLSMPSRVIFCFTYTFPKNSPSAVTDSTPEPPRFSARTYASNAAIMTTSGEYTSTYDFCTILNSTIPTNTPAPIPTMNFIMNGTACSITSAICSAVMFSIRSSTTNGRMTVSGVLNRLSSFRSVSTLLFPAKVSTASGAVPVIIDASSRLTQKGRLIM